MTDDLLEFLRLCLDEEQREAEAALRRTTTTRRLIQGQWVEDTIQPPEWRRSAWPPKRVLAEVDAKRRLLTVHKRDTTYSFSGCITCDAGDNSCGCMGGSAYEYPCETLRILALPYASHPDYQPKWAPDPA